MFVPLGLLLGLSAATGAPAEIAFEGGFPTTSSARIFPLSEVRRGQKGIGYTVFEADRAEPFDVEILGVMEGMLGPDRSVILARLSGKKIEFTGVISGMSGSPVYIDGRLLGAVSYRFGAFSKEPIAGITPIEDMLDTYGDEVDPSALAEVSPPAPIFRGAFDVARFRSRQMLPAIPLPATSWSAGRRGATPIRTPLSVSGLDPSVRADLLGPLEAAGFVPVAGAGGAPRMDLGVFEPRPSSQRTVSENVSGSAGTVPAARIAPGSPIAALLMRGDINVAAIGTVTWVNGSRVLGFGHPFMGTGKVAFPMATAAILNTLASEAGSYKQGAPAVEVGVIRQDRLTAIGGDLGDAAAMVPVRIVVHRFDEPAASPGLQTRVEIVDDPVWLPIMLENAVASAASRRMGYEAGGTVDLSVRYHVEDRVLEFTEQISAPAPLRVPAFTARDVSSTASVLVRNEFAKAPLTGIEVFLRVTPEVQLAELERVTVAPKQARPGDTIRLVAHLRPYRKTPIAVPFELPVPADAQGEIEIFVGGGVELDRKDGDARGPRTPQNLEDLMALLAARRPSKALYARVYQAQPGLTDDMAVMTALPPSQRAALQARHHRGLAAATHRPGPETHVPMAYVVGGGISVTVRIAP